MGFVIYLHHSPYFSKHTPNSVNIILEQVEFGSSAPLKSRRYPIPHTNHKYLNYYIPKMKGYIQSTSKYVYLIYFLK